MPLTIKVPVSELTGADASEVAIVVERTLKEDRKNAYTIMGLMVEKFKVSEKDLLGVPFSEMKGKLPTLYSQVRRSLEKLVSEGKARKKKEGRAFVYWWSE